MSHGESILEQSDILIPKNLVLQILLATLNITDAHKSSRIRNLTKSSYVYLIPAKIVQY